MRKSGYVALLLSAWLGGAVGASALTLTSPDVKEGGTIADEQVFNSFGCTGKSISPALTWSGAPKKKTCQKLLDKIGLEGKTFVTDDWEGYHRLIPDDQLFTGKDLTVSIEQDNSNIRHFLARFRRRTKVVSKVVEMVDLSLRIYHHFHDNLDAFAEKAAVFRAIFS